MIWFSMKKDKKNVSNKRVSYFSMRSVYIVLLNISESIIKVIFMKGNLKSISMKKENENTYEMQFFPLTPLKNGEKKCLKSTK